MARRLLAWLLALLLLSGVGAADSDDASNLVEEADAAMKERAYAAAEGLYRKALDAMETSLPALRGLGEALLAQDKRDEAVLAFRRAVRTAQADPAYPSAWQEHVEHSARRLREIDEHGRELETIVDDQVSDLVKLAVKHRRKDPDLSDRILDLALTLRPDHERALELRGKMSDSGARREAAFDGKQIDDWDGGRSDWWSVHEGVIVAETKGIASYIRTQKEVEGNFDVVMEARIAEAYDKSPFIAVMGAWKAEYVHSRFGVLGEALAWYEKDGEDSSERVYRCEVRRLPKGIDPAQWNTYELRFRKDKIFAVVNGKEVHSISRPEKRSGGYVGILAQGCRAEIRKLEIAHR